MPLLSLECISTYYGDARVLTDVSLDLEDGEIATIMASAYHTKTLAGTDNSDAVGHHAP